MILTSDELQWVTDRMKIYDVKYQEIFLLDITALIYLYADIPEGENHKGKAIFT
ncbi:hypothetical protein NAF17_10670 [Mucilaginibacter sp. RB4R14]|uniref:hypothetical protein n=1 Tax=Mucilaginibacter aurantiaciroseus TaxID=2949308 RepID=UPI002090CA0E|nr:hypothetical protein [Mucilaginibacter aurantiaciroseus]MCO5936002.1 hypothetical protein [Mucilaginibacter aurantiaciroseus]